MTGVPVGGSAYFRRSAGFPVSPEPRRRRDRDRRARRARRETAGSARGISPPSVLYACASKPNAGKVLSRGREKSTIDHVVTRPKIQVAQVRELNRVLKNPGLPNAHSLLCSDTASRLGDHAPSLSTTCEVKKQRSRDEHEDETACRHIRSTRGQATGFKPPRDRAEARTRRATPARRRPDLL